MTNTSTFEFIVDKVAKTITVRREFAADRALVWDAYTKSEILDQWWAPKPWRTQTKKMDFREGGCWIYAMLGPEGEEHWVRADYASITHHKRFTGGDAFTDSGGNLNEEMPQSKWDVTFTDKGIATLVEFRISYDDLASLEATIEMGFQEGWSLATEGLDELLPSLQGENR